MTTTPPRELKSRLNTLKTSEGDGKITAADAEAIRSFIAAYNPNNLMETAPGDDQSLKTGTCNVYVARLTEAARRTQLTEATDEDVNRILQSLTEAGRSDWTVHGYSTAFRKFYDFHDFGPGPDAITKIDTPNGSSFDPDDVLTRDEIHELLDAADNPRDRAVFALLIFTGMRNNALRTLRISDIDTQEGTSGIWKVNDDVTDGLKGIEKYGKKRPLLGARGPVREWLSYHPASDDPDAYLITGRPKYGKADPSKPVAGSTIRRVINRLVENSQDPVISQKPTHPHMMRHNFVTICKRDYDLPDETVKFLIGHSPASRVMETTYSHLSDEDHIERTEVGAGIRDPAEEESPLTPPVCDCGHPLPPTAKACEVCGDVYAPNAKAVEYAVEDAREEAADRGMDSTNPEEIAALKAIHDAVDDPTALAERLAELEE